MDLQQKIEDLEARLAEAEELIDAIKAGEVDAFALNTNNQPEVYTLQSGDYAYRMLIEKLSEGALNLTEEGLIVYTNTYFSELVGLPYEKVMGCMMNELIHPDSQEAFANLLMKATADNSRGEINLWADGRIIPVYVSLTSLQPKLATVGMILTDLSEKKQREKEITQLSRSDKSKSDFIKMASHELNTPVTAIKGYSQLLLAMLRANPDGNLLAAEVITPSLMKIDKQVVRLVKLIRELLDISRIEGGQLELRKEILNLNDLVLEAIDDIKITKPLQKINFTTTHKFKIEADKDRMSQVLSNLILNAIKYSPDSKKIDISIQPFGENEVAIAIRDYGIGINSDDLDKIFERFYRSEKIDEGSFPGFGIGLFISKEIVHKHQGRILVESEKGKGSVFTIILSVI